MGEKHKEMNKKMKGESEQRQQWWKRKEMLKEKMKQKETEQKQNVFCLIFCVF